MKSKGRRFISLVKKGWVGPGLQISNEYLFIINRFIITMGCRFLLENMDT